MLAMGKAPSLRLKSGPAPLTGLDTGFVYALHRAYYSTRTKSNTVSYEWKRLAVQFLRDVFCFWIKGKSLLEVEILSAAQWVEAREC